jgi:pimeloyl-ACP methyl ester carboxylesterase
VFAPTLTGLGERAQLLSPAVGLETHVQDVVGVLAYEDLHDVVLVGHSYAGTVSSVVADRVPERLAHLVYLDAQVGRDGFSALDQQQPDERARKEEATQTRGEGWFWPAIPAAALAPYVERGELTEAEAQVIAFKSRPHPFKTMQDVVRLTNPAARAVPRTYVYCTRNTAQAARAARVRSEGGWRYVEMDADHLVPLTHPDRVADLLLGLA